MYTRGVLAYFIKQSREEELQQDWSSNQQPLRFTKPLFPILSLYKLYIVELVELVKLYKLYKLCSRGGV